MVKQLGVIGPHTGQFDVGGMDTGQHHHLLEGIFLILFISLPEFPRFRAVIPGCEGLFQAEELGGRVGAILVDLAEAVVEPGADIGVQGFYGMIEGSIEQHHLVLALCQGLVIGLQLEMLLLAVGGLPLPVEFDLSRVQGASQHHARYQLWYGFHHDAPRRLTLINN